MSKYRCYRFIFHLHLHSEHYTFGIRISYYLFNFCWRSSIAWRCYHIKSMLDVSLQAYRLGMRVEYIDGNRQKGGETRDTKTETWIWQKPICQIDRRSQSEMVHVAEPKIGMHWLLRSLWNWDAVWLREIAWRFVFEQKSIDIVHTPNYIAHPHGMKLFCCQQATTSTISLYTHTHTPTQNLCNATLYVYCLCVFTATQFHIYSTETCFLHHQSNRFILGKV